MRAAILFAASLLPVSALADGEAAGKRVFDRVCAACHANAISEAPQLKQSTAWTARLGKGREALYANALNGFTGPTGEEMPPRGGQADLTDDEVKAAVDFIVATVSSRRTPP